MGLQRSDEEGVTRCANLKSAKRTREVPGSRSAFTGSKRSLRAHYGLTTALGRVGSMASAGVGKSDMFINQSATFHFFPWRPGNM